MDCTKCGFDIKEEDTQFCPKCGTSLNDFANPNTEKPASNTTPSGFQRTPEWKSEGTTLVLTIVLGLFGFGGIGHLYLGQLGKGIGILIVGIILLIVAIFTYGIGLVILIPFAIWVIFDARKQCRKYNDVLEKTGKAPW
ncbi:zinc-ribbon domain-containing protein [Candidatus Nitrosopumilus sediminis]|uniref:Uncharacterized protein n=1 Tax=Candidatus Nitrosopumilus sediminis TaxID=1229909 RepID=K0BAQ0_9ARCH|nr:zinc-ribbon domain-containing protein [Candidatus Nitrosopumilus sediminis]AFS82167.1 hypothetical protein NSED_01775 [Candidatus Nitrosopumilus sediminis]